MSSQFLYLTTVGRRTGSPHRIEIWFASEGGPLYLISGGGNRSDWVKNLLASPQASVELAHQVSAVRARLPLPPSDERTRAVDLLHAKYADQVSGTRFSWQREAFIVALTGGVVVTEDPTKQAHSAMPYPRLVGVVIRSISRDEVVGSLDWSPERCTAGGAMHGGALMSLADATGAMLAFANLPDNASGTTTITSTTNFLGGVTSGAVVATSRLVHRGRTTIVVETDLRGADDKLIGRVTQTQAVLR